MYTTLADIDVRTVDLQASIGDELVGNGYTAGGFALTSSVIYTPGGNFRPVMDFVDIEVASATWGQSPGTAAQGAVIYNTTSGAQSNKVLWVLNFGTPLVVSGGDLVIAFPDPTNPALAMVRSSG